MAAYLDSVELGSTVVGVVDHSHGQPQHSILDLLEDLHRGPCGFGVAHAPGGLPSAAHRNPVWPVALSGVLAVRAATLYRLQYDSWHR